MSSTIKLLPPVVEKVKILKDQYDSVLPDGLKNIVASLPYIWKVTVTPVKETGSAVCRVNIVASANNRNGNLVINAIGREPKESPASHCDDLRPMSWYAWNKGAQIFKVTHASNTSTQVNVTVNFE